MSSSLETEDYDLIIAASHDLPSTRWKSVNLCRDNKPCIVVNAKHPFAKFKSIKLIEAREEPFILLIKGYSFRNYSDQLFNLAGFRPNAVLECEFSLIGPMLEAQYGITLSSSLSESSDKFGDVKYVEISEPDYPRTFSVYWNRRNEI